MSFKRSVVARFSAVILFVFLGSELGHTYATTDDLVEAMEAATILSNLEIQGEFSLLYDRLHPDARTIVPQSAIEGWYQHEFLPLGPQPITVTGARFVSWTWPVTGVTYPDAVQVSYNQYFSDSTNTVSETVHLVKHENEWMWFFGRSREFVDEQVQLYGADSAEEANIQPTQLVEESSSSEVIDSVSGVEIVGNPRWWVIPFAEGYGNQETGHLRFGVFLRNSTDQTVYAGVSFRAYYEDGSPHSGCFQPLGNGPGVSTTIAPGESAWVVCQRTVVETSLSGLQVTARLWDINPLSQPEMPVEVLDAQITNTYSDPMETQYDVSALLSTRSSEDSEHSVIFRFYDADGVQVGTCEATRIAFEPEIPQRVTCDFPVVVDTWSSQPISVRVEGLPLTP